MPALNRLIHGVSASGQQWVCSVSGARRGLLQQARAPAPLLCAARPHQQAPAQPQGGLFAALQHSQQRTRAIARGATSSSSGSSGGGAGEQRCWGSTRSASSGSDSGSRAAPRRPVRCGAAADDSAAAGGSTSTIFTLPTILTLGRVAAVPALIAAWFWQCPHATAAVTGLFLAASITDWLDGYLARKMNLSSKFGAFLDPVADKLMVAAALILLCTQPLAAGPLAGNSWLVPAATLVIIGREITMSALREWAATLGPAARGAVAVNAWGKWKTAVQMASLVMLLMTREGLPAGITEGAAVKVFELAAAGGPPLLVIAAYLSAHSLALYLKGLWKYMA